MECQTGKPQCLVKIPDLHLIMVLILAHGKPQAPVGNVECQNGKTPTPAVGNMSDMSSHGNVVDMPSHGNVSGAWEYPQLGMKNVWNVTS